MTTTATVGATLSKSFELQENMTYSSIIAAPSHFKHNQL